MTSAVIVDFGKKVTVSKVVENKKMYTCVEQIHLDGSASDFLEHREDIELLFSELSKKALAKNTIPLIVTVSDSNYIYYHTDTLSKENLLSFDNKMNTQEKEEIIFENCKSLKPAGLNYISDDLIASCMVSYFSDTDVFLSCGFLSEKLVVTINDVAEKAGITLLGIKPFVYGIFTAYLDLGENLIFEFNDNFMIMNDLGLIVWDKIGKYNVDDVHSFLKEECTRVFSISDDSRRSVIVKNWDTAYLNNSIQGSYDNYEAISAIGCFMGDKPIGKDRSLLKGEKQNHGTTGSLWKFFEKKVR